MEGDYASNPVDVTLSNNATATVNVTITNDDVFELTETFIANLYFSDQETVLPGVSLNRTSAQVNILDNDCESSVLYNMVLHDISMHVCINLNHFHSSLNYRY